jgi:hypothetical protein
MVQQLRPGQHRSVLHRHPAAILAQPADHLEAIGIGQHDVQDD